MPQKTFHIITLGCKVNQYESEALREAWLAAGHVEQDTPEGSDLVLINSCAITAKAVSDLRALARRVRAASPACEILVTGCAAQALPDKLEELPVDALVPQADKLNLLRWLDGAAPFIPEQGEDDYAISQYRLRMAKGNNTEKHPEEGIEPAAHFTLLNLAHTGPNRHKDTATEGLRGFWANAAPKESACAKKSAFPAFSISNYSRSRAVLKIHDGCSQHCTYCIVPLGRGSSASRPWADGLAEAGRLIQAGFREIVISGINLRQYGADFDPPEDFWDFVTRLESAFAAEWAGCLRFRISSLEPGQLNEKALAALSKSRLIAPHLHISIQSGSPRILKRMGRGHYNVETLPDFLAGLGKIWPRFGLGADFIAGFPGESDEDFAETMRLAEALPLTYAHVFPYSRRPGTPAAKLPGQTTPGVKKERAARLRALAAVKKEAFLRAQVDLPQIMVAPEDGSGRGINEFYSDCRFTDKAPPAGSGLVPARPLRLEKGLIMVKNITLTR